MTLELLTRNCGMESVDDLFSSGLSKLLEEMKESYETWERFTPDRFVFDILVRRSTHAITEDQWEQVLYIIAANVDYEKDLEMRMDMLALLEFLLQRPELHYQLQFYADIVLKMILVPSIEWKIGKPN